MIEQGASIIDIGESTRPGSKPVSTDEEVSRVIPVIEGVYGPILNDYFGGYQQAISCQTSHLLRV